MGYKGEKQQGETIRLHLGGMEQTPDSTPEIRIEKNGTQILDYTTMSSIGGTFNYYYDHVVDIAATIGAYQVMVKVIVDGITRIFSDDSFDVSIYSIDHVKADTEVIIASLGVSSGLYAVTINIKDNLTNPVEDVIISINNSNNDDSPRFCLCKTDNLGNTAIVNLNPDTYTLRISKGSSIFSSTQTIVVTESDTFDKIVTLTIITPPSDPELCRLFLYAKTLSVTDEELLKIMITSRDKLTKISGQFISNTSMRFNYDKTSDYYYFDAVQGIYAKIFSEELGITDEKILVPVAATQDLSALIS